MVAMRDSFGTALAVGRFAGFEPLGFEAGDNNWYRFVANGPTGKTDPLGLREIIIEIHTLFTKPPIIGKEAGIQREVERIFANAFSKLKDHTVKVKWVAEPTEAAWEAVKYGWYGGNWLGHCPAGVRVGVKENFRLPVPGQTGDFAGTLNPDKIAQIALDKRLPFDKAVATVIAHEMGYHAIGRAAGHHHNEGWVDAADGKTGGTFSKEASDLIIDKLDAADGDCCR